MQATVPAEGENPGGRFVVSDSATPLRPADRARYGEGLAGVLDAVAERMPRAEVEAVWSFPGVRRDGKEYGVAVITRAAAGDRHRVYRARYVIQEKGQDRGKISVELEETAEAPAALLPRVIDGVRQRADEAGEADIVDLAPWKADDGERGAG